MLEKLETFLRIPDNFFPIIDKPSPKPQPIIIVNEQNVGKWYLVQTKFKKRKTFQTHLETVRRQNNIDDLIIEVGISESLDLSEYVLVRLSDYQKAFEYIRQINCFQSIERKQIPIAQVNKMLGRK